MGVKKLWDVIKPLCVVCDFYTDAAGGTIAIDASTWLHASAKAKGGEAALDMLEPAPTFSRILRAVEDRLQRLLNAGIRPVFVFDGPRPGAKAHTDQARADARTTAREQARAYLRGGGPRERRSRGYQGRVHS